MDVLIIQLIITVLVCGFADTLHDDLARARALRPDASVIACNNAASAVKAFAIFSTHCRRGKLDIWASAQRNYFGGDFEVHSHGYANFDKLQAAYPYVDYWWIDAKGVGTSAWSAVKMARQMGFSEMILCGAPIERRPYANKTMANDFRHAEVLKIYRDYIRKDIMWHKGVYSMSGWTRKLFGEPSGHRA